MAAPSREPAVELLRQLRTGDDATRQAVRARIDADPQLRAEIERLLATTVGDPSAPAAVQELQRRVGPYTLLDELGSGGMGAVFLAERDIDGARQQVALKLLHGVPTQEGRRRLSRERALLAGLNHPHIAALLDGGETESGQPYLVMEYVEGEPLGVWARRAQPSLAQRLRTLVQVCEAVAHAHQRLVLHRDIKPGNVLVRTDGTPVLLDFGIGRALDDTRQTQTATLAFTPAYAAPEQLTGRGLTTATDVHGLGLLLYELLTGIDLGASAAAPTTLRPPSQAAQGVPWRRRLRGDLDRIVARATHAEPERRYPGAAALAEDLERFMRGMPVLATADSAWYRLRKFLRRHRAASSIAALALVLASVFVWRLAVERERALAAEQRAQQEARSARMARNFLVSLFAEAEPGRTLGRPVSPRDLLDRARARIEGELGSEPLAAATTWLALADTYVELGDSAQGGEAAQHALEHASGEDGESLRLRAQALHTLSAAYSNLGRYPEALAAAERMLALREREFADQPKELANAYGVMGYAAQHLGDQARARAWFLRALELIQAHKGSPSDRAYVLSGLAIAASGLGDRSAANRWLEQLREATAAFDGADPARLFLLRTESRLAEAEGRNARSLELLEQASALAVRVIGAEASAVASIENDLGVALNGLGRYREALVHLQRARALYAGHLHGGAAALAFMDANIGAVLENLGDYAQAIEYARRALAVYTAPGMPQTDMRRQARVNLARALSFSGQHPEALEQMRIALGDSAEGEGAASLTHLLDRYRHAGILRRAGRLDDAQAELDASLGPILALVGDQHPLRLHVLRLQALIARDRGERARAIEVFEETLAFALGREDVDRVALAEAGIELAELLHANDPARARELLAAAQPVLDEAQDEKAPARTNARRLAAEWGLGVAAEAGDGQKR